MDSTPLEDNKNNQLDTGTLAKELEQLFTDTIGEQIKQEVGLFNDFTGKLTTRIEAYNTQSARAIKEGSLQALLFENGRLCNDIFEMLDEHIKDKDDDTFSSFLARLRDRAFQLLEQVPENETVAAGIRKLSDSLEKNAAFKPSKQKNRNTLPKKEVSGEEPAADPLIGSYRDYPNRSFFFHFLITENIAGRADTYVVFLKNLLSIINFLVTIDQKRISQFSEFAAADYELASAGLVHPLVYDTEKLKQLTDEFNAAGEAMLTGTISGMREILKLYDSGTKTDSLVYRGRVNIGKAYEQLSEELIRRRSNWNNTIFLLSEDWKLDLELHAFRFFILKEYFNFSKVIQARFTRPIEETILQMSSALNTLKEKIEQKGDDREKNLPESISRAKMEFKRNIISRIIPSIKEAIISANLPGAIDTIETGTNNTFNDISRKRYVAKHPDYNKPTERSQFETISLRELVGYEIMPRLKNVFPNLKSSFFRHVQSFEAKVAEIPEIIDFAISSSLSYYEKEQNAEEAIRISTEGINRVEKKLTELREIHKSFITHEVDTLRSSIEKFIEEITAIANSESVSQINLRIARLKALEKSKEIRRRFTARVKGFVPVALSYAKKGYALLWSSSEKISKQFRVADNPDFITSETSEYLTATEEAINRLPYVYQRLFKNEPLKTFELFVGRSRPDGQLSTAYNKWKEGRFAPVVIIGETGSGKTSLLNWFLKNKVQNENVILLNLQEEDKSPEMIYQEIEEQLLDKRSPETGGPRDTILAIDGLARLFTSEINGFQYLLKTMKLISETNARVFWIVLTHLYSWNYIDKAFKISDYFSYHITLSDISPEDLRHIIERRHNLSGFRLVYEPSPARKSSLLARKVNPEKMQQELEEDYFKSLSELNSNNLSQAFLYWLRSISRLEDDVVYIRQLDSIDHSFVKSISLNKMYTLKNILIHNGLTNEGHARRFHQDPELSKMHLDQMTDDGLLIRRKDYYLINPLIYSQVVKELFTLNLLH